MKNFNYVKNPNLPENKVSYVIMSDYKPEFIKELESFEIKTIIPDKLDGILGAEAYHADMTVCHIGENKFITAKNNKTLTEKLCSINAEVTESIEAVSGTYPKITSLNVCIFGNNLICNTKFTDKNIIDICRENKFHIFHTNQGYTKCSSVVISSNAIITADESIYKLCRENKIDVLKIFPGDIILDGYDYGFIGGTCGFIDKNTLAFSGNIKLHKNYYDIRNFAQNYGVDLLSLSNDKLCDIGGILPIIEKTDCTES